jgi:hypothetical protein
MNMAGTQKQETQNNKGKETPPPMAMTKPPETTAIEVYDYGDDAGQGFENQDMSDRKLPMLMLLQSNSPQVVESKGKIPVGSFLDSVSGEIYEDVTIVAAVTDHCYTAWIPRDDGGGFKGRYAKDDPIIGQMQRRHGSKFGKIPFPQLDAAGKPKLDAKGKPELTQELVESFEIYCIVYRGEEVVGFAVIPFTSAKIKIYKAWNSQIQDFSPTFYYVKDASGQTKARFKTSEAAQKKATEIGGTVEVKKIPPKKTPMFAHRVRMTSESDTNAKGTFMIPVLSPAEGGDDLRDSLLDKTDPRYQAAKLLHDQVLAGLAKAAWETTEQDPAPNAEEAAPF